MSGRLAGKVALITGAAWAWGARRRVLFAEEGARVVVADIDAAAAKETAARIGKAGGEALAVVGDVARRGRRAAHGRRGRSALRRAARPPQQRRRARGRTATAPCSRPTSAGGTV